MIVKTKRIVSNKTNLFKIYSILGMNKKQYFLIKKSRVLKFQQGLHKEKCSRRLIKGVF